VSEGTDKNYKAVGPLWGEFLTTIGKADDRYLISLDEGAQEDALVLFTFFLRRKKKTASRIGSLLSGLRHGFLGENRSSLVRILEGPVFRQVKRGVGNMLLANEIPGSKTKLPASKEFISYMWEHTSVDPKRDEELRSFMASLAASIQFNFVSRVSSNTHKLHKAKCEDVFVFVLDDRVEGGRELAWPWRREVGDEISMIVFAHTTQKTGRRTALLALKKGEDDFLIEKCLTWMRLANWKSPLEDFFLF